MDLLGLISALLGAAQVAGDFSAWLRARADPCSRAVARTIAAFPNLEGLQDRFKALLDLPRLEVVVQDLKSTGEVRDLEGLAGLFVEECAFYWGEESRTQAEEVLRHFFEALNEEVLMSPEAHPVMDARFESGMRQLDLHIGRVEGILTGHLPAVAGESHIPAIPSAPGLPTAAPEIPVNIPPEGFFVGREDKIAAVNGLLEAERLVVLHGEPGIGKSALAREVAQWQLERGFCPGGEAHRKPPDTTEITFVPLQPSRAEENPLGL